MKKAVMSYSNNMTNEQNLPVNLVPQRFLTTVGGGTPACHITAHYILVVLGTLLKMYPCINYTLII